MYGHGGIDFPSFARTELTFKKNRVKFQVDSVGPIGADVWSWGHILS